MEINEGTERKKLGARETEADLFCDASVGNYRAETGRRGPSAIKASMQGNGEVTAQPGTPRDRDKFSAGRNLDKKGKQPLSDQGDNLLEQGTRHSSKSRARLALIKPLSLRGSETELSKDVWLNFQGRAPFRQPRTFFINTRKS